MSHDLEGMTVKQLREKVRNFKKTHCPSLYRMKKDELVRFLRDSSAPEVAKPEVAKPEAAVVEAIADKVEEVVAKKVRKPRVAKAVKAAVANEIVKVHQADAKAHIMEAKAHKEAEKDVLKAVYDDAKKSKSAKKKSFVKMMEKFNPEVVKPEEKKTEEKKKKEPGAYAKFMAEHRKAGKSMKEIAEMWKASKAGKKEEVKEVKEVVEEEVEVKGFSDKEIDMKLEKSKLSASELLAHIEKSLAEAEKSVEHLNDNVSKTKDDISFIMKGLKTPEVREIGKEAAIAKLETKLKSMEEDLAESRHSLKHYEKVAKRMKQYIAKKKV